MHLRCITFDPGRTDDWDELVAAGANGTFLHTRRFLSYHGDRFEDRSLILIDDRERPVAVFPAALDPANADIVISHPGITYGGLVHGRAVRGDGVLSALDAILNHYRAHGLHALRYKAVPAMYHRWPAQDDLYALFRRHARLYRRDLSATVDLACPQPFSQRRRRGAKRARSEDVAIVHGLEHLSAFWTVLEQVLCARHGVCPVHDLAEIRLLAARFPRQIEFIGAARGAELLAGAVLFRTETVCHAQYIAAGEAGSALGALDLVFETAIDQARQCGLRWFDFGISTESQGTVLNSGLHEFKTGFGAGATTYDFYELPLQSTGSSGPPI